MSPWMSGLLASALVLAHVAASPRFQADPTAAARLQEGKATLERISADPTARGCWASAVEALTAGCKGMDDAQRSRLAVRVRRRRRDPP